MKKRIKKIFLLMSILAVSTNLSYGNELPKGDNIGTSLSYGKAIVGHKGNILEESLNNKDKQYEKKVYNVAPGVYSITGFGMDNINVIESDNGIIVIDGGMTPEDAIEAQKMLPPAVAKKPVKAFIYTHWHYIFGAGEWNVDENTRIIAHENHKSELENSFGNPVLQEVTQIRGGIQLGMFLPDEGPDSSSDTGLVKHQPKNMDKYLAPTEVVGDKETKLEIDGVEVLTYAGHSDTKDGISIYFPEQKVSIDNVYWAHGLFNLSTLRGDKWRDPQGLIDGGEWLLSKDINHSLKVHGYPVDGEVFRQQIKDQNEFIQYTIDATTEAIGKGMSPDELQYAVELPEHLKNSKYLEENYGELSYHVRRYYTYLLHWFGNDSVDLHPLPRNTEAEKMVEVMGGVEKVKTEAREAYENGEYQWSAQLATYAIRTGDTEAKQIKADALRAMAQVAKASNTRNWYLTHALVLEGKIKLPIVLTGEY